MKKVLCVIVTMSSLFLARAQVVVEEEEYLKELISSATIMYCDQDTLYDGQMIKKIELLF